MLEKEPPLRKAIEIAKRMKKGGPVLCIDPILGDDKPHPIFWRNGEVVIGGPKPHTKGAVLSVGGPFGSHLISGNEDNF